MTKGEGLATQFLDEICEITGCDIEEYTLTKWAKKIDKALDERFEQGKREGIELAVEIMKKNQS